MATISQPLSAEELARMPDDGTRSELIRGELRQVSPSGSEHVVIIARLTWQLAAHVEKHALGIVFGAEGGFLIERNPDTVRAPDLAFVQSARVPASGVPTGYLPGAPDLAVEVLSPSDRVSEADAKVTDWLTAGTRTVWVINPRWRTVTVFRSPTEISVLTANDMLNGADVIGGFRGPVHDLFGLARSD